MKNLLVFLACFSVIFVFITGLGTLLNPKEPDVISSSDACHEVRDGNGGGHADSVASR